MDDPIILKKITDIDHTLKIPPLVINTDFIPENKQSKFAICYLVQNKSFEEKFGFPREKYVNRIDMFLDSLRNLKENFLVKNIDIHIFHEGDLTMIQMKQILTFFNNNRHIFIHKINFEIPSHIDAQIVQDRIKKAPYHNIKEFRTIGYRHMCSFYSYNVYPIFINWGYEKLMRLDDDSFLLEKIDDEIFELKYDYIYRLEQIEDEKYMMYFTEFITQFCKKNKLKLVMDSKIVFNNFFIVNLDIYKDIKVIEYLNAIYHSGGIYYCRWGDALIQSYIFKLFPEKFTTKKFHFNYEKWGLTYTKEQFSFPKTTNNKGFTYILLFICISIIIILLLIILAKIFIYYRRTHKLK